MVDLSRRGFLGGLAAALAAPAIVAAPSLMPIRAPALVLAPSGLLVPRRNPLLTIGMITREAVKLWVNSNELLRNIAAEWDDEFYNSHAEIGTSLRIRLPADFKLAS